MINTRINNGKIELVVDDIDTARLIMDKLSAFEPGYAHNTLYKIGKWSGKRNFYEIFPIKSPGGSNSPKSWLFYIPLGFREKLEDLLNITIEDSKPINSINPIEFLKREMKLLPFVPYKHQVKLFMGLVQNYSHLGISSVGSGKSLSLFLAVKYFIEQDKKILLLVPTIMLVNQIYQDFIDYGADEEFMKKIQQIGGDFKDKDIKCPIVISTWQSAQKSNLGVFNIVINDEAQTAKADILDSILQQNQWERKLGVTGSMPIIEIDALILESNFGEPKRYINARQMMNMGMATEMTVVAMYLNYPQIPKSKIKTYQDEIKFMKEYKPRQNFINNLLNKITGVTVALYAHTDHGVQTWENFTGVELTSKIKKSFKLQKELGSGGVFFLTGSTKPSLREEIRLYLNTTSTALVIAQYSIMSTGINIPRLKNLVYLSSNKSFVQTLQSIGRVLRLHKDKTSAVVYDLVDCMSGKRLQENYLQKHFFERSNFYQQEEFPVKEMEIDMMKYDET